MSDTPTNPGTPSALRLLEQCRMLAAQALESNGATTAKLGEMIRLLDATQELMRTGIETAVAPLREQVARLEQRVADLQVDVAELKTRVA